MKLPYGPFIYIQFDYVAFIIISLILICIKKYKEKKNAIEDLFEEKLIFNKKDIATEFGVTKKDYFIFINLIFVIIKDLFEETSYLFKCSILTYWMFEMLYYELFHSRLFKTKMYKHHIYSIIFILFSCSIIKTISIIINFVYETETAKFLNDRKWLIPTAIIIYFLARILRTYTYSNEKYYFEKKIISIPNYMLIYGIYGLIISSICALISTYVPCGDDTIPELSKTVCQYKDNNGIYYFDSYKIFFDNLYSEQFAARLILLFVKSILQFCTCYFVYVIYKKLSPVYYLCMHRLNVLFLYILAFINYLIENYDNYDNTSIYVRICDILIIIFF